MKHIVTKKVRRGSRRLFFSNPRVNGMEADLTMTFYTVLGIELYYGKCVLVREKGWFYVDIPTWRYRIMARAAFFEAGTIWAMHDVQLSGKYENVTGRIW